MSEDKAASIEQLVQRATQLDALAKVIVELEDIYALTAERANGIEAACALAVLLENNFADFADNCVEVVPTFEASAVVSALAMFAVKITNCEPLDDAVSKFFGLAYVAAREISAVKRKLTEKAGTL